MSVFRAIGEFLGLVREIRDDSKEKKEINEREDIIKDIKENRPNSARRRLYSWLRRPKKKSRLPD